jgi:hypothetical protein
MKVVVSEGSATPILLSQAERRGWHLECSGDPPEPGGIDIGTISKIGDGSARTALYEAANVILT